MESFQLMMMVNIHILKHIYLLCIFCNYEKKPEKIFGFTVVEIQANLYIIVNTEALKIIIYYIDHNVAVQ